MPHYQFYYDETEHSRVINQNTISAENFYDNFISVIVGWADIFQILCSRSMRPRKYPDNCFLFPQASDS